MRTPSVVAAFPLMAGSLVGLLLPDATPHDVAAAAAFGSLLALLGAVAAGAMELRAEALVSVAAGCALAGLALGLTAASRAYHPSLLRWFDAHAGPDPGVASVRGPGGDGPPAGRGALAVVMEGRLREDAVPAGPSLLLLVDVDRIRPLEGLRDAPRSLGRDAARSSERRERRDVAWPGEAGVAGGVRVSVSGSLSGSRSGAWRAGRRLRMAAVLRPPATYLDPGVRDDRPALARRGIVLVGTVKSGALIDVVGRGGAVEEAAAAARAWTRRTLAQAVGRWSPRSAAIATAVLIGDRTGLPDEDTRRLQDAGTYHVIAISGGNIAILTVLLLGVLRELRLPVRAAACAAILLLTAYSAVVVPAASVQRAVVAGLRVPRGARVLDQRGSALNVLAVAATVGIAWSPAALFDPGFLLSFGATLGILAMAARAPAATRTRRTVAGAASCSPSARCCGPRSRRRRRCCRSGRCCSAG